MRSLPIRAALLCAAASTLLLAACGGSSDDGTSAALETTGTTLAEVALGDEAQLRFTQLESGGVVLIGVMAEKASAQTREKLAAIDMSDLAGSYTALAPQADAQVVARLKSAQGRNLDAPIVRRTIDQVLTLPRDTDFVADYCSSTFLGLPTLDHECIGDVYGSRKFGENSSAAPAFKEALFVTQWHAGTVAPHTLELLVRVCGRRVLGLCVQVVERVVARAANISAEQLGLIGVSNDTVDILGRITANPNSRIKSASFTLCRTADAAGCI